jgi:hypothetical protein
MSKRWAETTQNIGESFGVIRPDDATHGKQFLVCLAADAHDSWKTEKKRSGLREAIHFRENN